MGQVMDANIAKKELILFADDSKTARAAAVKILRSRYRVIEAADGESAWQKIQGNPDIKLVFSDINMPVSNGFELLGNIRNSSDSRIAGLPVIIITGIENSEAAMRAAIRIGATDFISKPVKGIDMLCRTHSYISLYGKIKKLETQQADAVNALEIALAEKSGGENPVIQYEDYARKCLSLSNRQQLPCTFANIEVEILHDISLPHSKEASKNLYKVISTRLTERLREEDLLMQIKANRFGLILPVTSQIKSQVLLLRLVDAVNAMILEFRGKEYRLSAKASVYTCSGSKNKLEHIYQQLEAGIIRSHNGSSKIIICENNSGGDETDAESEEGLSLNDSLLYVLNGDYHKIVDWHVQELQEKLGPFLQFASSQTKQAVEH